jgi:cytochrome c oxidase cbb3-type subunit 3
LSADETNPPGKDTPAGGPTRGRRLRLAAGIVAVLLVALAAQTIHTRTMYAKLLRTEGDRTELDPGLVSFASGQAKAVIAKDCASCHGPELKGDPKRGIPNLADADWLYGTGRVSELEQTILYGIRSGHPRTWNLAEMPGFGLPVPSLKYKTPPLTPGQISDLVQYVRFIGDKPADAAAAARGVKLFADTGQCFDCHATDGAGDEAIGAPNLIDDIWLYGDGSPKSVFNSIAHGHHGVCPSWVGRLKPGEIRALAVYIHHNAAKAPPPGAAHAAAPQQREKQS